MNIIVNKVRNININIIRLYECEITDYNDLIEVAKLKSDKFDIN